MSDEPLLDDWIWEIRCEYPRHTYGQVVNIFRFNSQKDNFVGTTPNDCIFCPEHVIFGDEDVKAEARKAFLEEGQPINLFFVMGRFVFNDSL